MPPKGDSVEEGEILLSTTLSELSILENHDDMCVYEGKPARKYTVSSFIKASVDEILFEMTLISIEGVEEHPYIEKLDVTILDAWKTELEPLVTLVMENKEPTMLLTGLRSFANEIQYRQNVWQWMKKEWSSYVIIPAGKYSNNVLVCTDKQVTPSKKPKFLLSWMIDFSSEGIVQSSIQPYFTMKCDDETRQEEIDELAEDMRSTFQSLQEVKNVEAAIRFLMNCILD